MSGNINVIKIEGLQCRIVLYDRHVLQLHKTARHNRLSHRHCQVARGWRKCETRIRYFLIVPEPRNCNCTLRRCAYNPFYTVKCAPEPEIVEVERLDCGAGIQDREGGSPVHGLLFESRDDHVRKAVWDHGHVDVRGLVEDPGVEELGRIKVLVMMLKP